VVHARGHGQIPVGGRSGVGRQPHGAESRGQCNGNHFESAGSQTERQHGQLCNKEAGPQQHTPRVRVKNRRCADPDRGII